MVLLLRSLACSSMSCAHLRFHLRTVFFFFLFKQASASTRTCVSAHCIGLFSKPTLGKKKRAFVRRATTTACYIVLFFFFTVTTIWLGIGKEKWRITARS